MSYTINNNILYNIIHGFLTGVILYGHNMVGTCKYAIRRWCYRLMLTLIATKKWISQCPERKHKILSKNERK